MAWSRVCRPPPHTKCPISFSTTARITGPLASNCRLTASCVSGLLRSDDLIFQTHWELRLMELGGDRTDSSKWMLHSVSQDITRWFEPVTHSASQTLVLLTISVLVGSQNVVNDGPTHRCVYGPLVLIWLEPAEPHIFNYIPQLDP